MTSFDRKSIQEQDEPEPARLTQLRDSPSVVWVDVVGLGTESVLRQVAETFGLHALALEDVVNGHQRPKVEEYGDQMFVVLRLPHARDGLWVEQIGLFVGRGFVVTFQEKQDDCFDGVRGRLRNAIGRIRASGADYLAYALIDSVVDHYFPIIEHYSEALDELEDRILGGATRDTLGHLLTIKRELMTLRREIWPLRDAVRLLLGEQSEVFGADMHPYLRDCYDHLVRAVDLLDAQREIDSNLVSVHLSMVSQRMNEVMKVLTIIATIFIPLTFVAGIYGMNFDTASPYNMPELGWRVGYPFALGLMAALAGVLLFFFWRKGWLRSD